ncbi:MAG: glycosyltransferase family 4 protein, partial [Actinomycetota bacterium]
RITPHKGLEVLIQALPKGARLMVAGSIGHDPRPPESDYPKLLAALARGKDVEFLGPIPERDLPALYRQAVTLVLPSVERTCYGRGVAISELLGLSQLEAMASGTPVICSRVGGAPEVVHEGETGFVVEPGDARQLEDRIRHLLRDRELARRMGDAGRDLVTSTFTWDRCAQKCLEAYEELAGPASQG